jgi:hypothetical protein
MIDPDDYWVNNPLITPINKALMYDNAIWMAKMDMKDDIVDLLENTANSLEHLKCYGEDCWCIHSVKIMELINEKFSGYQE